MCKGQLFSVEMDFDMTKDYKNPLAQIWVESFLTD